MKLLFLPALTAISIVSAHTVYTRDQILQEFSSIRTAYSALEKLPANAMADDYADALLDVLEHEPSLISVHDKKNICRAIINLHCLHGDTCSSVSRTRKKEALALLHRIEQDEYYGQDKKLKAFARRADREYEKWKARRHQTRG